MQTIPLEESDVKILKKRKLLMGIFFVYMLLLSIAIAGFVAWMYLYESERLIWQLMLGVLVIILYVDYMVHKSWNNVRMDFRYGEKTVIQGVIASKISIKNSHELVIDGVPYQVKWEYYTAVEKGQTVLISFAPNSKLILDMQKIN